MPRRKQANPKFLNANLEPESVGDESKKKRIKLESNENSNELCSTPKKLEGVESKEQSEELPRKTPKKSQEFSEISNQANELRHGLKNGTKEHVDRNGKDSPAKPESPSVNEELFEDPIGRPVDELPGHTRSWSRSSEKSSPREPIASRSSSVSSNKSMASTTSFDATSADLNTKDVADSLNPSDNEASSNEEYIDYKVTTHKARKSPRPEPEERLDNSVKTWETVSKREPKQKQANANQSSSIIINGKRYYRLLFQCDKCGLRYSDQGTLMTHQQNYCSKRGQESSISASSSRSSSPPIILNKPTQSASTPAIKANISSSAFPSQDSPIKVSSQVLNTVSNQENSAYRLRDAVLGSLVHQNKGTLDKITQPVNETHAKPSDSVDNATPMVKSYIFQCNSCSFQTDKKSLMNKHSRVHLPLKRKAMEESSIDLKTDDVLESNAFSAFECDALGKRLLRDETRPEAAGSPVTSENQKALLNKPLPAQLNLLSLDKTKSYCHECEIQFSSIHTYLHHRNNYCQKYKTIEAIVPAEMANKSQSTTSELQHSSQKFFTKNRKNSLEKQAVKKQTEKTDQSEDENSSSESVSTPRLVTKETPSTGPMRMSHLSKSSPIESAKTIQQTHQLPNPAFIPTRSGILEPQPPLLSDIHPSNLHRGAPPNLMGNMAYWPILWDQIISQFSQSLIGENGKVDKNSFLLQTYLAAMSNSLSFSKSDQSSARINGTSPYSMEALADHFVNPSQPNDALMSLLKLQHLSRLNEPQRQQFGLGTKPDSSEIESASPLNLTKRKQVEEQESDKFNRIYDRALSSDNEDSNQEADDVEQMKDDTTYDSPLDLSKKPAKATEEASFNSRQSSSQETLGILAAFNLLARQREMLLLNKEEESQPSLSDSKPVEPRSKGEKSGLRPQSSSLALSEFQTADTYRGLKNLAFSQTSDKEEDDEREEKLDFAHEIDERFLRHPLVRKTLNEAYASLKSSKVVPKKPFFMCTACGYQGNTSRGVKQHGKDHLNIGEHFGIIDATGNQPRLVFFSSNSFHQSSGYNSTHREHSSSGAGIRFDERSKLARSKQSLSSFFKAEDQETLSRSSPSNEQILKRNFGNSSSGVKSSGEEDGRGVLDLPKRRDSDADEDSAPDEPKREVRNLANYCQKCDIKFAFTHSFLAHKKTYCSGNS